MKKLIALVFCTSIFSCTDIMPAISIAGTYDISKIQLAANDITTYPSSKDFLTKAAFKVARNARIKIDTIDATTACMSGICQYEPTQEAATCGADCSRYTIKKQNSRVEILRTDAATGAVSLYGFVKDDKLTLVSNDGTTEFLWATKRN